MKISSFCTKIFYVQPIILLILINWPLIFIKFETTNQLIKMNKSSNPFGFTVLIIISIILLILLLSGQTYALINYKTTVNLGLQESIDEIGPLGIAWAKAFALGDTLVYIPLLFIGIIGILKKTFWGYICMLCSLGISVYWPVVNLSAIFLAKDEIQLIEDKYISYSILLPLISLYGIWGIGYLYKERKFFNS